MLVQAIGPLGIEKGGTCPWQLAQSIHGRAGFAEVLRLTLGADQRPSWHITVLPRP
jgi:hypothetical protein